jgi:hypothetical protein
MNIKVITSWMIGRAGIKNVCESRNIQRGFLLQTLKKKGTSKYSHKWEDSKMEFGMYN